MIDRRSEIINNNGRGLHSFSRWMNIVNKIMVYIANAIFALCVRGDAWKWTEIKFLTIHRRFASRHIGCRGVECQHHASQYMSIKNNPRICCDNRMKLLASCTFVVQRHRLFSSSTFLHSISIVCSLFNRLSVHIVCVYLRGRRR